MDDSGSPWTTTCVDPEASSADPEGYQYERLDNHRLQSLVSGDRVVPLLIGGNVTRLSLAGAQDKLPVALNVAAGNSDGHAKNLSILYDDSGARIAPFYDLLATREYASLDRNLTMGVGGRRDPDKLGRPQWDALAAELGLGARVVIESVRDVADQCIEIVPAWTSEFRERHGDEPILQTLPREISKRARRLRRALT